MTSASSDVASACSTNTLPPPGDYGRALLRERLDAAIFRAIAERRSHRGQRQNAPSGAWDDLEEHLVWAATLLWELPAPTPVCDDLLAYCAFLARELEVTESMDLAADDEWTRLEELAPRAVSALDEITEALLEARAEAEPAMRALTSAFGALRAELAAGCVVEWSHAA